MQLQVNQGDPVRETKDVAKLQGQSYRTRTWTGASMRKPGDYTLTLIRGGQTLKSFNVKVTK